MTDVRCKNCGGFVRKFGTVKRVVRSKNRETSWIKVQRYQCKECGFIFRDLSAGVMPFKQYEAEVIDGVVEGLITNDVLGFEDYPCEITMRRWKSRIYNQYNGGDQHDQNDK